MALESDLCIEFVNMSSSKRWRRSFCLDMGGMMYDETQDRNASDICLSSLLYILHNLRPFLDVFTISLILLL